MGVVVWEGGNRGVRRWNREIELLFFLLARGGWGWMSGNEAA